MRGRRTAHQSGPACARLAGNPSQRAGKLLTMRLVQRFGGLTPLV